MAIHEWRCDQALYVGIIHGQECIEVFTESVRTFKRGDRLVLREWDSEQKADTGRKCIVDVMHVWKAPADRSWVDIKRAPAGS